jgi:hypothetical protein
MMKALLKLTLALWWMAALLSFAMPSRADPNPFAKNQARAEQLCHELKQKASELATQAQQIPDPAARAKAVQEIDRLTQLVDNAEVAITAGPEKLGIGPREYNERLLSVVRAGNWQAQRIEQQSFGRAYSIAARVTLPSLDNLSHKISRAFDGSGENATPTVNTLPPLGRSSEFFKAQGSFQQTDREKAVEIDRRDGHIGGGIMLEGAAEGLDKIDPTSVRYDPTVNAITINGDTVYFLKIAPWNAQALCRQIADDQKELVGVTMSSPRFIVFGDNGDAIYHDTEMANDLLLADGFLRDIVFNEGNWNLGYKYPGNFKPQSSQATEPRLVRWAFKDFRFKIADGKAQLTDANVEARIIPVKTGAGGKFHPDGELLAKGYKEPPEEVANVRHIVNNMDYYRQERIIGRVFAYGETAALLRSLKRAGADLGQLARAME